MKAKIVLLVDGEWVTSEVQVIDLIPAMEIRGFSHNGYEKNPKRRVELQGQPTFSGLLGPMWDGNCIRYENQAAYNRLSA